MLMKLRGLAMSQTDQKPYISPSQVFMYTRCGEAYRRRYIEKHKIPPGIAMTKGISVHKGAEFNFKAKIQSKKDKPVGDIVDVAVSAFEGQVANEGLSLNAEEESIGKKMVVGKAKDSTAKMASVLMTGVAHKYQPVTVEEMVTVPLETSSHNLRGVIDLEVEGGALVDLKTSAKSWSQDRVDKSIQLPFYGMMKRALTGSDPSKVIVENIIDGSKTSVKTFERVVGMDDYLPIIRRLNRVLEGINAKIYTPAKDDAWWCSAAYCGYFNSCEFVRGGK